MGKGIHHAFQPVLLEGGFQLEAILDFRHIGINTSPRVTGFGYLSQV